MNLDQNSIHILLNKQNKMIVTNIITGYIYSRHPSD